jgi:hypothetical protein
VRRPPLGWTALLVVALARPASPADGDGDAWGWLAAHRPGSEEAKAAPGLPPAQEAVGRDALGSVVTLAVAPRGVAPSDDAADATGFLLTPTGLLATTRGVLARSAGGTLWGRTSDGRWMPAVPVAATWWGDVGLARLVGTRRDFRPMALSRVGVDLLGRPLTVVGAAVRRRAVVSGASPHSIDWFDPTRPGTAFETVRNTGRIPGKGSRALALRFRDPIGAPGREGSPVLDGEGRCVGMVLEKEGTATSSDLLEAVLARVVADGAFDPPELGVRLGPLPTPEGPVALPPELAPAREKEKSGALVLDVALGGPSQGILWEGDVVLEVAGVPVAYEVPQAYAFATEAMTSDVPADVVVFRGGKRRSLQVVPRRASAIYPDFAKEHSLRSGLP